MRRILASLAVTAVMAVPALVEGTGTRAQSLGSSPSCGPASQACPTPSPEASTLFPPMQFSGGDPSSLVITSTCGVWGRDAITLYGEGDAGTARLEVTFSDYDAEAAQWFGRVTGTFTAANGTVEQVDDAALVYYAFDTGRWMLVARHAEQILATGCSSIPSPEASPGV